MKNMVVVIMKASKENGRKMARTCAEQGARIICGAPTQEECNCLVEEFSEKGLDCVARVVQGSDSEHVDEMLSFARQVYGRADAVVLAV